MSPFIRNANTDYIFNTLTSPSITRMSDGKIPQMTAQQAAGLMGSWAVETGDPSFQNLDVVESVAGAGRGLSQYTGARRQAYDRIANQAGSGANNAKFQMQYFADEYAGKYDRNGASLVGYTRVFENAPKSGSAADYARYYTGSASSGQGYFRPSVPHFDKRSKSADSIFQAYGGQNLQLNVPTTLDGRVVPPSIGM